LNLAVGRVMNASTDECRVAQSSGVTSSGVDDEEDRVCVPDRHKRNARLVSTTLQHETDTKNAHYDAVRSFACEVVRARDVRDVMARVSTGGREAARAKHKAPPPDQRHRPSPDKVQHSHQVCARTR